MCKRILIVRTSSLGDVVHVLPTISDINKSNPGIVIDWVLEESFSEIALWHFDLNNVFEIADRRWRKSLFSIKTWSEKIHKFKLLRSNSYDFIIDLQGLIKSAWLSKKIRGRIHGLDKDSARESLSSLFYDEVYKINFWQPAIMRNKLLASKILKYNCCLKLDFGLSQFTKQVYKNFQYFLQDKNYYFYKFNNNILKLDKKIFRFVENGQYITVMPSASSNNKLWSYDNWRFLFSEITSMGLKINILSGNESEYNKAKLLAYGFKNVFVIPLLNLTSIGYLLFNSKIMIGLDTGLTHLSAALGIPTVGIYTSSYVVRTPVMGNNHSYSLGNKNNPPTCSQVLYAVYNILRNDY